MKLGRLIDVLCPIGHDRAHYAALADLEVRAITNDSRRVIRGALFIALKGADVDGHNFIAQALEAGAAVIVTERPVPLPRRVVHLVVPDVRLRLAELGAAFHGRPAARLHVTGITGTNGKTTTSYRLRSVLEAAGRPAGLIGTVGCRIGQRHIPARNTTPDGLLLQELFAQMVDAGLSHVVMEVSSHALDLRRVDGVSFRVAVFTCLSDREHLDYHKTLARYRDAKARLFEMLGPDATAVINADDPVGPYMAERARCPKIRFGIQNGADVSAKVIEMDMTGMRYRLTTPFGSSDVRSSLVGEFNVMNDLAAAAAAAAAGVGLDAIVEGLERGEPVPGRLERIAAADFYPLVDYAHNEGALESVLRTIRQLAPGRILLVFGCGGNRDVSKRPAMGAAAEKYADLIFLTADNSRSENTRDIIAEIEAGMTGARPTAVIPERDRAIRAAVDAARPADVVLVAGKGHETYQIIGHVTSPFDDREVLRDAIALRVAPRNTAPAAELVPVAHSEA